MKYKYDWFSRISSFALFVAYLIWGKEYHAVASILIMLSVIANELANNR